MKFRLGELYSSKALAYTIAVHSGLHKKNQESPWPTYSQGHKQNPTGSFKITEEMHHLSELNMLFM